jgi:hypothetical protein
MLPLNPFLFLLNLITFVAAIAAITILGRRVAAVAAVLSVVAIAVGSGLRLWGRGGIGLGLGKWDCQGGEGGGEDGDPGELHVCLGGSYKDVCIEMYKFESCSLAFMCIMSWYRRKERRKQKIERGGSLLILCATILT